MKSKLIIILIVFAGAFNRSNLLAIQPLNVVSHMTHDSAGPFDIPLPLTGPPAIECRQGNPAGSYQIVLTFL